MATPRACKGAHLLLEIQEYNAMGAVALCLLCKDTFQIGEASLRANYYHTEHKSPEGPAKDLDFFIHERMVD